MCACLFADAWAPWAPGVRLGQRECLLWVLGKGTAAAMQRVACSLSDALCEAAGRTRGWPAPLGAVAQTRWFLSASQQ